MAPAPISNPLTMSAAAPFVMPGLVPGIHVFVTTEGKSWMAGS